jgi:type I restriction enzyme R subunit
MTNTTPNQTPEQRARDQIDRQLIAAGWQVQDNKAINLNAGTGIAVRDKFAGQQIWPASCCPQGAWAWMPARQYQTDVGPADYVLFVNQQAVGVIEAKPEAWGHKITAINNLQAIFKVNTE